MSSVADRLALWGILRPAEVVEIATAERLDLAAACVMLEKESSGGRNVWGSDPVPTGGYYVKGSEVTREDYERWRPHRARLGSQGVGPCQLTYPPLQDQADAIGGCWEWRANVRIGFRHLARLLATYGERGGFRRYNGSGSMAERYADDALARLERWRTRLGSGATALPPAIGDEVDMASLDDLRAIVREEAGPAVWNYAVPDYYRDETDPPPMAAFAALAWAATNVGRALDFARYTARLAESIEQRLGGAGVAVPNLRAELVAAIAEIGPFRLTTGDEDE